MDNKDTSKKMRGRLLYLGCGKITSCEEKPLADLGWEFSHIFSVVAASSRLYPLLRFEKPHRYKVGSVPGMLVPEE
uniref:Uncharacterized protein n=1 Tax=Arundo donax TaxID=35708 RepID=A0A0A9EIJ1_ARUDO